MNNLLDIKIFKNLPKIEKEVQDKFISHIKEF